MRKVLFYIMSLFVMIVMISSCKKQMLVSSSGRPYEVLLVSDKTYWNSISGESLLSVLHSKVLGLPQLENSFRVMYTEPVSFDQTLELVRSIIIVRIEKKLTPALKCRRNVYATPQCVLTIQAPDEKSFSKYVHVKADSIIEILTHFEMECQINALNKKYSETVYQTVDSMYDCDIHVPMELCYLKKKRNFIWASANTATADQNFMMYSWPLDTKTITLSYFMAKCDSVMQINMLGYKRGLYMSMNAKSLRMIPGKYKTIVRGLWYMKGDFMGGPFVAHVYLDKIRRCIYVAEVFVYSPGRLKGNLIRGLEASLYTLRFHTEDKVK